MTIPRKEPAATLSPPEMLRYSRHVVLPHIGVEGQEKLKRGRVLIVGAGGLGCPAALYLAAAGVGHIGIADYDKVDASNLQRQVLYREAHVGRSKAAVAAEVLREVNPHITVARHETCVDEVNAAALIAQYDMVLDGCDNVSTRYALNAACVAAGKPYIYGSVYQFEGQVSVFGLPGGPCYACLFPSAAPGGCTCAQAGVLGVVPGIVGAWQAAEAIKLILGLGDVLSGRLLVCDTLGLRFDTFTVPRDPACPCCGMRAAAPPEPERAENNKRPMAITADDLARMRDDCVAMTLLDVREHAEMLLDPLPGALHIPLSELPVRLGEVPREGAVVVYCRRGVRSAGAAMLLVHTGVSDVRHLTGGLHACVRRACATNTKAETATG